MFQVGGTGGMFAYAAFRSISCSIRVHSLINLEWLYYEIFFFRFRW